MLDKAAYIIAEAGVNHNGSTDMAIELIDVAVRAQCDAVKFQTFKAELLVSKTAPRAEYQKHNTQNSESQYQMLKRLELSEDQHRILIEYSKSKSIEFLSTPFDRESLELLTGKFGISKIKIPSGEITNAPFLLEISKRAEKIILSTGMSNLSEIEAALSVIAFGFLFPNDLSPSLSKFTNAYSSFEGRQALKKRVVLLHATTEYPAPFDEVNLSAMNTLKKSFSLPVGYSDHTEGIHIPIAAIAMGASVIEKHFTLDKNLPGPDHKASLEPDELIKMVRSIREIESAFGDGFKIPSKSEIKNMKIARKSLHASEDISNGDLFASHNLICKRPGNGISPIHYWEYIGKKSNRDYIRDDILDPL
ncbi:N-acetylneuraminate synthase [Leptospira adleri]|uniref:N-acetylneuraminate synthase n=1 Tax=Leptospira adleri TaxID=2023186 RepID=A0A2M9YPC7_9LEPT|nr:N-acetylneuraminate synthase [Leptospira adleri]PJZ53387.1 N-acetylneuraminate synthase [Leptospira adleri]PJZ61830.1 N-acetylneuraminate synthase [Leptospira adleri]